MCGLHGVFGPGIKDIDVKVFHSLAIANIHRGVDGTGVMLKGFGSTMPNSLEIDKGAVNAVEFWGDYVETSTHLKPGQRHKCILGHNRAATVGDNDEDDNAHPFYIDKSLVVFHNGTLVDKKYLQEGKTDSELLAEDIHKRGLKTVLEELDPKSAFALVIYDVKKDRIYMARNNHRHLALAVSTDRSVFYYSSDFRDLEYSLLRNSVHGYTLYGVNQGHIFTFIPSSISNDWDSEEFKIKEEEKPSEYDWGNYYKYGALQ